MNSQETEGATRAFKLIRPRGRAGDPRRLDLDRSDRKIDLGVWGRQKFPNPRLRLQTSRLGNVGVGDHVARHFLAASIWRHAKQMRKVLLPRDFRRLRRLQMRTRPHLALGFEQTHGRAEGLDVARPRLPLRDGLALVLGRAVYSREY